ncbi:hypothetical protein JRO89_XS01G0213600 [Xanthoceras sorbifolium]|uniref:Hydroxyproline-rich glycoprotein family protein n=1 Tax=Xanthoceras sorbifolium TaxID=99658 RepID=A0ABQ8IL42_9ROSI|nr:hypothetical protein JRO89_XS01G0213600 [Xanthoceras sorbifolium]
MKSLSKLRKFALHKSDTKDKSDFLPSAHVDELAQAAQDMQNMRNCYDSLLSAAAATANSAYEFSESLREMGSCLLEKTSLHEDEESGRILSMLGKVQFELQKLVDNYRTNIFLTITNPSESLLNELRTVENTQRCGAITCLSPVDPKPCFSFHDYGSGEGICKFYLASSHLSYLVIGWLLILYGSAYINKLLNLVGTERNGRCYKVGASPVQLSCLGPDFEKHGNPRDMKRQCDEKRNVYEYMVAQQREKGRSKGGKGESFTFHQLQTAHDQYDEEATLCVFRLKSLKQGQHRSLLTQAARHHAAQLNFFRKGVKSLEAVDAHVRLVAEQQHIDYQFCGHENDDGEDGEDDDENSSDTNADGELSFNNRQNQQGLDVVSTSRNSMEEDEVSISFPQTSAVENAEVHLDKYTGDYQVPSREPKGTSYSAPIFAEKKIDLAEKIRQMQQSPRKSHTYVLPTPIDSKVPIPSRPSVSHAGPTNPSGRNRNLSHSLPLEQKKQDKDSGDGHLSELSVRKAQSVLKESNSNSTSSQLPPPLAEGFSLPQLDKFNASDTKKFKRQSFSGPLTSKPLSTKQVLSSSGPINPTELPQLVSGLLSQSPAPHPSTSPRVSPSASPPLGSSPKISELHELPRPPGGLPTKAAKSSGLVGHSAPLMFRNQDPTATSKIPSSASNTAAPLPTPPLIVPRSFSIPSSSQRAMALHVSRFLESPKTVEKAEDVSSPPLTPISLSNIKPVSLDSQSGQNQG